MLDTRCWWKPDEKIMSKLAQRKRNRLSNYDYSTPGVYFVTICSKDRHWCFWNVGASIARPQSTAHLSYIGLATDEKIHEINVRYPFMNVDNYVIMPNHVHLLLSFCCDNSGRAMLAPTTNISKVIQQFKGAVTKALSYSVWQKSFHDRVVRNEAEYLKIYKYIDDNPYQWIEDRFYIQTQITESTAHGQPKTG